MIGVPIHSERVYKGSQAWEYEGLYSFARTHRLKVHIRRNAYDDQSWARCYRWDGAKWQLVGSRTIEECVCKGVSYVDPKPEPDIFRADADTLLAEAVFILGD